MAAKPLTLVEILREEGLLPLDQIHRAQQSAEQLEVPLVSILLEQQLVDELDLRNMLREKLHLPEFEPEVTRVDPDAVRLVPMEEARRYRIFPISLETGAEGRALELAMVDPLDTHASDNVAFTTGARVHPHLALDSHLEGAIHANYKEIVTKVIQRNPDTAAGQPIAELETEKRDVFGAGLGTTRLATKPMGRTGPEALADPQFKALLELLIRKGVLSRQEYEQELRGAPESSAERDREPE